MLAAPCLWRTRLGIALAATILVGLAGSLSAQSLPQPVHWWTFNDGTAKDLIGSADGTLSGAASIANGKLYMPGGHNVTNRMLTAPIGSPISTKTLVVWTSLINPADSTKGSALVLQSDSSSWNTAQFDAIVYGEAYLKRWMAGSDNFNRTQYPQMYGFDETETHPHEVMIAISYASDNSISVYRNGQLYGSYTQGSLVTFNSTATVEIGPRVANYYQDVYDGYVNEARIYNVALNASQIQALWQAGIQPTGLIHQWTFEGGSTQDSVGGAHGTLYNGASVTFEGGRYGLRLDGVDDYMRTSPIPNTITEKTLVAWVKLDNLGQQSGGVLTLENPTGGDVFDSIVYGERTAQQWMAGSDHWRRSDGVNNGGSLETSTDTVMLAIAYGPGNVIDIYRNGELYASYTTTNPSPISYPGGIADVLLGLRHEDRANTPGGMPTGNDPFLAGWIDEARIYDHALTLSEVRYLFNEGPVVPEPGALALLGIGGLGLLGLAAVRRHSGKET